MTPLANSAILVVDDERNVADTLAAIFRAAGYESSAAYSAEDALDYLREFEPALIISDVVMPGISGVDLAISIRGSHPGCPVLLISGNATTRDLLESAREKGFAFEVLAKPVPPRQLLAKVASVVSKKSAPEEP